MTEHAGWKQTSLCPEARPYPTGSWSVSWDTQDEGRRKTGSSRKDSAHHLLEHVGSFVIITLICWGELLSNLIMIARN